MSNLHDARSSAFIGAWLRVDQLTDFRIKWRADHPADPKTGEGVPLPSDYHAQMHEAEVMSRLACSDMAVGMTAGNWINDYLENKAGYADLDSDLSKTEAYEKFAKRHNEGKADGE